MCSPTLIFTAVTTLASGYMAKQQADDQADYQEGVGEYNARVEENQAQRVANKGVQEENIHREKVARMASSQKAQFAAAGVDVGSGSALDIQQETKEFGNIDALRIRESFQDQSTSLIEQSSLTRHDAGAQSQLTRSRGKSALTGSLLSAAATGVSSKWLTPKSAAVVSSQGSAPVLSGGGGAPVFVSR